PVDYCDVDPASLSDAEREVLGIRRLPRTFGHAVEGFLADQLFQILFCAQLVVAYANIMRVDDLYYGKLELE
ncbi:glutamine synthetase, partial [Lactobacillus rhamnosus]|nr:glutamine synthetase [Lacticaseibacillus rhamnosus]